MFKISFQRMGAHARFAKLCAVGGVAASFALVKVEYIVENQFIQIFRGSRKGEIASCSWQRRDLEDRCRRAAASSWRLESLRGRWDEIQEGRERDEKSLFRRLLPRRFMSIRGSRGSSGILIGTKGRKIEALAGSVTFWIWHRVLLQGPGQPGETP